MDTISIRYGETLTLPLDASDLDATSASIFIGKPGEVYKLTQTIALVEGQGTFEFAPTETEIPLGKYSYQINVTSGTSVSKFPSPSDGCDSGDSDLPTFIVAEALDATEVM